MSTEILQAAFTIAILAAITIGVLNGKLGRHGGGGGKRMSAEQRQALSERMKNMWAGLKGHRERHESMFQGEKRGRNMALALLLIVGIITGGYFGIIAPLAKWWPFAVSPTITHAGENPFGPEAGPLNITVTFPGAAETPKLTPGAMLAALSGTLYIGNLPGFDGYNASRGNYDTYASISLAMLTSTSIANYFQTWVTEQTTNAVVNPVDPQAAWANAATQLPAGDFNNGVAVTPAVKCYLIPEYGQVTIDIQEAYTAKYCYAHWVNGTAALQSTMLNGIGHGTGAVTNMYGIGNVSFQCGISSTDWLSNYVGYVSPMASQAYQTIVGTNLIAPFFLINSNKTDFGTNSTYWPSLTIGGSALTVMEYNTTAVMAILPNGVRTTASPIVIHEIYRAYGAPTTTATAKASMGSIAYTRCELIEPSYLGTLPAAGGTGGTIASGWVAQCA